MKKKSADPNEPGLNEDEEELEWPCSVPDQIEQDIIAVISTIPDQAAKWVDSRSRIARLSDWCWSVNTSILKEQTIGHMWTNEIIKSVEQLGKRSRYSVVVPPKRRGDWMYNSIIWRDVGGILGSWG